MRDNIYPLCAPDAFIVNMDRKLSNWKDGSFLFTLYSRILCLSKLKYKAINIMFVEEAV